MFKVVSLSRISVQSNDVYHMTLAANDCQNTGIKHQIPFCVISVGANVELYLHNEGAQSPGAFKVRGAAAALTELLKDPTFTKEVVTASAGNHASGLADQCFRKGVKAIIYMPKSTDPVKIKNCTDNGAEVRLTAGDFDDARNAALEFSKDAKIKFIHPYDDYHVIAGQGGVMVDIFDKLKTQTPHHVLVVAPVGGGGLMAGIANTCLHLAQDNPGWHFTVLGVELLPEKVETSRLQTFLSTGERIILPAVNGFAAGAAVKQLGEKPSELLGYLKSFKDRIRLDASVVTRDEIIQSMKDLSENGFTLPTQTDPSNKTKKLPETTAAMTVAAAKQWVIKNNNEIKNTTIVPILTGSNISQEMAESCLRVNLNSLTAIKGT